MKPTPAQTYTLMQAAIPELGLFIRTTIYFNLERQRLQFYLLKKKKKSPGQILFLSVAKLIFAGYIVLMLSCHVHHQ